MGEIGNRHDCLPVSKAAREYMARVGSHDNAATRAGVAGLFTAAGLPCYPSIVDTFFPFGGGVLPMGLDGRFTVHRARKAIRMAGFVPPCSANPDRFRISIGQSEFIQPSFTMDGNGRIYEDERRIADSLISWIESWASRHRH